MKLCSWATSNWVIGQKDSIGTSRQLKLLSRVQVSRSYCWKSTQLIERGEVELVPTKSFYPYVLASLVQEVLSRLLKEKQTPSKLQSLRSTMVSCLWDVQSMKPVGVATQYFICHKSHSTRSQYCLCDQEPKTMEARVKSNMTVLLKEHSNTMIPSDILLYSMPLNSALPSFCQRIFLLQQMGTSPKTCSQPGNIQRMWDIKALEHSDLNERSLSNPSPLKVLENFEEEAERV